MGIGFRLCLSFSPSCFQYRGQDGVLQPRGLEQISFEKLEICLGFGLSEQCPAFTKLHDKVVAELTTRWASDGNKGEIVQASESGIFWDSRATIFELVVKKSSVESLEDA